RIQTFCCPACGGFIGEAAPLDQVMESVTQPSRRLILGMLAKPPGAVVLRDRILDRLYGHRADGGPETGDHVVKAMVSQLRRQIEPFGWTITGSRGGSGNLAQWRLVPREAGQ
ncbi:MAG: winged helix-turn-helix domain-containing protein, partial [Thermomicrobium sp.]